MLEFVPDPNEWIDGFIRERGVRPMIYVAHPVAATEGQMLATCSTCGAGRLYENRDAVDLYKLCPHDTPCRTTDDAREIVAFNLARALRWWRWFHLGLRAAVWQMPWFVNVTANGEGDRDLIKLGLRDDCEIVKRCDALMLCGPIVRKGGGMELEAQTAIDVGNPVFHVHGIVGEPHGLTPSEVAWRVWRP